MALLGLKSGRSAVRPRPRPPLLPGRSVSPLTCAFCRKRGIAMALTSPAKSKINTVLTQLTPNLTSLAARPAGKSPRREAGLDRGRIRRRGRGVPGRAVFTENGQRRFRQAMTEPELAVKLANVIERLAAQAPNMERPGADLIALYLDLDRLPVKKRWSRRHPAQALLEPGPVHPAVLGVGQERCRVAASQLLARASRPGPECPSRRLWLAPARQPALQNPDGPPGRHLDAA